MNNFSEIQQIAYRFDLSLDELRALLLQTDQMRGMLTASDLERGLGEVLQAYLNAMGTAAERFVDPVERMVADRMVSLTVELLSGQLQAAPYRPN